MNRNYTRGTYGLFLMIGLWLLSAGMASATSYSWANVGSSWSTAGNWSPSGVPTGTDTVNITTSPTNYLPTISDARSVSNLTLQGSGNVTWTINGTGSLAVSNAVKLDRHNAFINVNFILCSNTVFGPGAYIGDQNTPPLIEGIWLTGGLSGSGPLAVQGNGSVGYQNNAAPIFTGGTMISGGSYVNWVMTNAAGSYAFGFDAGGVNPGTIAISNSGTFGLAAFTAAGTPQEIGLTNPIVVAGTGGSLFGCEGTNTHGT